MKAEGCTSRISDKVHCKECGWPVVSCCTNWDTDFFLDSEGWDWWVYCSNKACKNHKGEGVFQNGVDWISHEE